MQPAADCGTCQEPAGAWRKDPAEWSPSPSWKVPETAGASSGRCTPRRPRTGARSVRHEAHPGKTITLEAHDVPGTKNGYCPGSLLTRGSTQY
ncbi:hypothetical protein Scani_06190 [Streptomyces caniferus]|uniref:Uncharacterized protein n=1 Tax=Streptomyces caniferus TaxID=285557 RepID=A0A640S1R6_9ACTN|nr:hypothetical protein Scani_06190 [Streptomyces caniferus]